MNRLYEGDCLSILPKLSKYDCIFVDIPDNIQLKYNSYNDNLSEDDYIFWISKIIKESLLHTDIFWISFNAKWTAQLGYIVYQLLINNNELKYKPCIQSFTFGQYNKYDFCNNYRPLWRINKKDAIFYPSQVLEPSWRLLNNDPRANPKGKVPGDVFNVPRVVGNSKQRKKWMPTQLNTILLEKIIKFSTPLNGLVLDLCAGSGSMYSACNNINRQCDLIEIDKDYCTNIVKEYKIKLCHI